jgi:hypothetical protein
MSLKAFDSRLRRLTKRLKVKMEYTMAADRIRRSQIVGFIRFSGK